MQAIRARGRCTNVEPRLQRVPQARAISAANTLLRALPERLGLTVTHRYSMALLSISIKVFVFELVKGQLGSTTSSPWNTVQVPMLVRSHLLVQQLGILYRVNAPVPLRPYTACCYRVARTLVGLLHNM